MKFENDATTASGCTTPRFAQRQAACGKWTLLNISRSTTALATSWWASKTGNSVITSLWALIDSQVWTKRGCWNNTHTELRKWTLIDCDNAKLLPITILSIFFYCLPRAGASALITRARAHYTRVPAHTRNSESPWLVLNQPGLYTLCRQLVAPAAPDLSPDSSTAEKRPSQRWRVQATLPETTSYRQLSDCVSLSRRTAAVPNLAHRSLPSPRL